MVKYKYDEYKVRKEKTLTKDGKMNMKENFIIITIAFFITIFMIMFGSKMWDTVDKQEAAFKIIETHKLGE